jgi:hypothetical protein
MPLSCRSVSEADGLDWRGYDLAGLRLGPEAHKPAFRQETPPDRTAAATTVCDVLEEFT